MVRKQYNVSDNYIHKYCQYLKIKSDINRCKSNSDLGNNKYPNIVNNNWISNKPFEIVVSDTTTINHSTGKYNLTLYIDTYNNEILSYDITRKGVDELASHIMALDKFIKVKNERGYKKSKTILHTDQGLMYSTDLFNYPCQKNNITHSMSRLGKPTDNAKIEAINGWIKQEMEIDFHFFYTKNIKRFISKFIHYYNNERPSHKLKNMSPVEYRKSFNYK